MDLIEKKIDIDDKLESDVKADNAELFVYPWMAIVVNNVSIYDPKSKNSVRKNAEQIKEEMLRLLRKKEDGLRLKSHHCGIKKEHKHDLRLLSLKKIWMVFTMLEGWKIYFKQRNLVRRIIILEGMEEINSTSG
jgi:hypothetical protein